jgi:glycosyltransferase involved in cell wall biosynthesis
MNRTHLPLVSVIMIFLDEEKFIQEAVESVLAQTYPNWELLLVDDGSTDRSTEIARGFENRYPRRICYLEHEGHQNKGMSATRNLGIRAAQGEYITFLDADDVWLPGKLERQVSILESRPEIGFLTAPARYWYSWSEDSSKGRPDFVQQFEGIPVNTAVGPPALLLLFLKNELATVCDLLCRREVIAATGGYEERFRGMYEDQAFHAKLCLRYPVYIPNEVGYLYRQHPDSCTSKSHTAGLYISNRLTYLKWLDRYLKEQKVNDRKLLWVLHRQVFPLKHPNLGRLILYFKLFGNRTFESVLNLSRKILPSSSRGWLLSRLRGLQLRPPVGWVRFGSLRRVSPVGPVWPNRRGLPVDRYYIEGFLERHAGDVKGHVLELGDASYTRRFGGDKVTKSDVLHAIEGNPSATIVADLTRADHIPSETFDCIILTQTLLLIYDLKAAVQTLFRILKPGGVLLVTVPGITPIVREDMEECGQYWSFTNLAVRRLFGQFFADENLQIEVHGNVLSATAFLYGLAAGELRKSELDFRHPDYELIIALRAQKPEVPS